MRMVYESREELNSRIKDAERSMPKFLPRLMKNQLIALSKFYYAIGFRSAEKVLMDKKIDANWLKVLVENRPFNDEELMEIIKSVGAKKK